MLVRLWHLALLAAVAICLSFPSQGGIGLLTEELPLKFEPQGVTDSEPTGSPLSSPLQLFNGHDLSGFYTWLVDSRYADPRRVFTVVNGMIRISGDGLGYLATRERYRDYHLVVEWKWGNQNWAWGDRIGKARDSGIFLHAVGPDGNSHDGRGAFMAAIECNVFQGATGDLLLIRGTNFSGQLIAPSVVVEAALDRDLEGWPYWSPGGTRTNLQRWGRVNHLGKDPTWKDELDFRGAKDQERPVKEWNRVECICRGDQIRIYLNGIQVNQAAAVGPSSGRILLQCEGSEIFFRRIELFPLKKDESHKD